MKDKLSQLFCTHNYYLNSPIVTESSERVGDDNNIVATVRNKCTKCGKERHANYIMHIEKDYYKEDGGN